MMTVRESPSWRTDSGSVRCVRGMLVTLCALLAVLLHHELPNTPVMAAPAVAGHSLSASAPASAAHAHKGATGPSTAADGTHNTACPSMAMQLCTAAGVSSVKLAAPSESPIAAFPTHYATVAGPGIARSVSRAPPDLSVLSQLRI